MAHLYESMNDVFSTLPVKIYRHHFQNCRFTVPLHWHRSIEVTVNLSGSICFNVSSNNFDIRESDWIIVNSGELHSCRYINDSEKSDSANFTGISIILSVPFVEKWIGKHTFFNTVPDEEVTHKIKALAHELYDLDFSNETGNSSTALLLMSKVYELMYLLATSCVRSDDVALSDAAGTSDSLKISEEFTNYIEQHYQEAISLQSIADHFKYSTSYFSRLFKDLYGVNFHAYLNFVRCSHAAEQLASGKVNMTDCAFENGFPNTKSFISTFKTIYGCTPKTYVAELK